MNLQLHGKLALVMAASMGIGRGVAAGLIAEGSSVVISSSVLDRLETTAREIGADDFEVIDVSSAASTAAGVEAVLARHGRVDILVTNSPGPTPAAVLEPAPELFDRALQTNLVSVYTLVRACVPAMKTAGFGRLIHLSSTTGREPDQGMVLSNVTRAGVLALSKTLARELGPHGITSNAILTGGVMTDRVRELFEREAVRTGVSVAELYERANISTPVGFIPTPDAFAKTVVYLASPLAAYVNGVNLPLDGGTMRAL